MGAQDVIVAGFGVDLPTNMTTVFGCFVPDGLTSFTVPAFMLSNLPASRANPLQSKSVIYVVSYPDSGYQNIKVQGLDSAYTALSYINGKTVTFQ